MLADTKGESLERSNEEPGIERRRDGAVGVLEESEFGEEGGGCSDEVPSKNIRVTSDVLCGGSYDHCCALEKGLSEIGRGECVVDNERDVSTLSDGSEEADGDEGEHGVRRSFGPDKL